MSFFEDIQRGIRRNGTPVTAGIVIVSVASFLLEWLLHVGLYKVLYFAPDRLTMPWTLVTYPFASVGDGRLLINLAFASMWIWWIGSVVERDLGSARFAIFWASMSALAALSTFAFTAVLGLPQVPLFGVWLPEAAITAAWATRYPMSVVQLIIFPIQARWLGLLTAGLILFEYGTPVPLLGVAACLHLGVAWAVASNKIPFFPYKEGVGGFFSREKKVPTRYGMKSESYFEDVRKREKERKEREELRKLFERSLIDDPDDRKGRDSGS